jgi:hypothetical protein
MWMDALLLAVVLMPICMGSGGKLKQAGMLKHP